MNKILLSQSSTIVKKQGEILLSKGALRKLEGKKYNDIYSIYGDVDGYKSYIKINTKKKFIEKVSCTCDEFQELSKVKAIFMCKHITCTSLKFLSRIQKNKDINRSISDKPISRIIRKVKNNEVYYEGRRVCGDYRIKIEQNELAGVLRNINKKNIKFTYDYLEVIAALKKHDIPMRYNFKRDGESLIITTYKKLPIPLNEIKDVWLFNKEIYLPEVKQISSFKEIYKILKEHKELKFPLTMDNIVKSVKVLDSTKCELVFDHYIKNIIKENTTLELYLYENNGELYLDVFILYGNLRFNIFSNDESPIRNKHLEEVLLTQVYGCGFRGLDDKCIFIGGAGDRLRLLEEKNSYLYSLGQVTMKGEFNSYLSKDLIEEELYNI
ncbi:MAG: SNF2 helicase associated domain-containing protein [Clostridium sp.]